MIPSPPDLSLFFSLGVIKNPTCIVRPFFFFFSSCHGMPIRHAPESLSNLSKSNNVLSEGDKALYFLPFFLLGTTLNPAP